MSPLMSCDLDDLPSAAVLVGPGPLLEPAHDHDPAPPTQRLGRMLGLVAPHGHGEERRLLLLAAADDHSEHGSCDPALGVLDLGSPVRLPAKLTLAAVMVLPSCCLAGRSALPLEPGTVDAVAS